METLARIDFVAQLVAAGYLTPRDGIDVLNRSAQTDTFTQELAALGLEVTNGS